MRDWLREASADGLSVDVWISLKLEWSLLQADALDRVRRDALIERARREADSPRIAPSAELRRWLAFLGRGPQQRADHDLPSVALPARVAMRIAPAVLVQTVLSVANEALDPSALVVERAASLNGMTMESWAYRALALLV